MASKVYDVVAVTGSYTDRNGVEKRRYVNCGAVFQTDKGLSLKLESLPVAFDGWLQLYEPREPGQGRSTREPSRRSEGPAQRKQAPDDYDDDIPF